MSVKPPEKKIVSIGEAAKILGVSIDTIRRWDKQGIVKSHRPDGKNRYFEVEQLEEVKFGQGIPISEAASQLGISATTLRRLEKKGLIKPKRNGAGERVYTKESLAQFLHGQYFLRQRQVEEKILEPLNKPVEQTTADEVENPEESHQETTHKILGAVQEETRQEINKLIHFKKVIYGVGLFVVTSPILIIVILTVITLLFPEQAAQLLGYSYRPNPLSSKPSQALIAQGNVLGASAERNTIFGAYFKPFMSASLNLVKVINPQVYQKVAPKQTIQDINDVLAMDDKGNIVPKVAIKLPDISYLQVPTPAQQATQNNVQNQSSTIPLLGEGGGTASITLLQPDGTLPGLKITQANITAGAITSSGIADGSITSAKLDLHTLANFTPDSFSSFKASSCSKDQILSWNGSSLVCSDAKTSSGIQLSSCSNGQIPSWDGSKWKCADQTTSTSISSVSNAVTFSGGVTLSSANFDQSGSSGTFKTGTGAVSLNGDTTIAASKALVVGSYSSDPSSPSSGTIFYNSTSNKFKVVENSTVKILCNTTDVGCGTGGGVSSLNSLIGVLTIAGAGINSVSASGTTVTITGTEADTLSSVTGRGSSTASSLTLSSATPITFSGTTPTITFSGGDTTFDLTGAATRTLALLNSTSSQVANLNLSDGELYTNGTSRLTNGGGLQNITGYTQSSGSFASTLTTTNVATFSSSTSGADSIALLPQSTTTTNAFTGTITTADLTGAHTWTFPNADGTVAVSASSPISLSSAGQISCSTCMVSGGSLFTLAGDSGSGTVSQGNTVTIAGGSGLTSSVSSTTATLTVGAGTGISVAADSVAVDQSFSPTWTGTQTFTPSGTNGVTMNLDADSSFARVFSSSTNNTTGSTYSVTNSASSGTIAVTGQSITLVGTANSTGSNTVVGISFPNASAATNNSFYGLSFGTGLTDILRYNGTQIVSGAGVLQSPGLSGTYSNALTLSNASNNLTVGTLTATGGTINGITIGATTRGSGAFTTLDANSTVTFSGLGSGTATSSLCLDASNLVKPCTSGGSTATLQSAYNNGNTITTTDARNIAITLADTATDQSVTITQQGAATALSLNDTNAATNTLLDIQSGGISKLTINELGTVSTSGNISTTGSGTITSAGLLTGSAGLTVSGGSVSLNDSAGTNTVSIGGGTTTGALTIGGTGTQTLNIGNGAGVKTVNLGSSNTTSGTTILSGSGGVSINVSNNQPTNINTGTSTGTVTIGGGSAPLVIDSTNFDVTSAGALSGITGYTQASGNFAISGTGTFGTGTGAISLNGDTTIAAGKNLTLPSGAGTISQTYSSSTNNTSANVLSLTNSASSGTVTVNGFSITPSGTSTTGSNTLNAILLNAPATPNSNSFYALNVGTGYNDILRYNGTEIISGTGIVQSAAISGSYTGITGVGTLTAGSLGAGFTTVAVARGGTGVTTFGGTNTILYTTSADTLSSITTANNGVLITSSGGVPSISSTLPSAVQSNITSVGTLTGLTVTSTAASGDATAFTDTSLNSATANLTNFTFKNANTAAGLAINGVTITENAASVPSSGANTSNLLNLSAAANGTVNGINISSATGFTNFLKTPSIVIDSSGNISGAGTIGAGNVTAGTYNGATITSTSFDGATLSGGSLSGGTISGGTLSGTALSGTGSFTLTGGTAASETLTLISTSNTTKGDIQFFSSSNKLTSAGALTIAGALSASNVSGTNTGDQTSVSGNAGTATALQTARTINGVSFDGTANITVTAAAGTLTGTTLNSSVVTSSLTSVGTLTGLTVTSTGASGTIVNLTDTSFTADASKLQSLTVTNASGAVGATAVSGLDLTLANGTNTNNSNTTNGINFPAAINTNSNTINGINFASATGFTNFLKTPSIVISSAGNISGAGTIGSGAITSTAGVSGTQLTSTIATGTAPLVVTSTTNVANLNASTLSGATFAAPGTIGGTTPGAATFTSLTDNTLGLGIVHSSSGGAFTSSTIVNADLAAGSFSNITGIGTLASLTISGSSNAVLSVTSTGTTGSVQTITDSSLAPAASGQANGLSLTITDTASNTTGNSVTTGIDVASTVNTTGATGTKDINALNVSAPTLAGCTGGACIWNGLKVTTTAPTSQITVNGLNILGATAPSSSTINGLNIGAITGGAGTETALSVGSGWDTILSGTTAGTNLIGFTNFTVSSAGAITAPTSTNTINSLIINGSTQTLSANNIADSGALTIKTTTTGALTLDSGTTGTINIGTGTSGKTINIGTDNTTADTIVVGSALDTIRLAKFSTVNGVLYVDNANGNVSETAASTGAQCLQTSGVGTAPIWGACGAGGARLDQITAATASNTIANANFAQTWNWGTLTTETGMTFGGGTAMTTGTIFSVGGATFVHTALNDVGQAQNVTFTDASTNANNGGITSGVNITSTINTSGAGTKTINALNVAAPTFTACATGTCTWNGTFINTTAPTSQITVNGLNIAGSTAPASSTINGVNIGAITAGAGTETGITVGSGWDTILSGTTAGTNLIGFTNFTVSSAGALTAVGVNSGTGLLQGTGGLTLTGAVNVNTSGANATNIGTGTNTGTITIGNSAGGDLALNDPNWTITGAGLITTAGNAAINGGTITSTTTLTLDSTSTTIIPAADTFQTDDVTSTGALSLVSGAASNISLSPGTTGDTVINVDADTNLQITAGAAPGVDMVAITNAGFGTTTTAIDGIDLTFVTAAVVGAVDNSAVRISVTSGATEAADTLQALTIGTLGTPGAGAETAINVGTGWDTVLAGTTAGTNLISFTNFSVSTAGAVTAVGVNSGTGLLQGTGGLTITGATNINTSGANATNIGTGTNTGTVTIGNTGAPLALASTGLNVTTGGALTGVASLDTITTSATALTFAGAGTVAATGANALTLTGGAASTWSTGSGNALTLTSSSIQVSSAGVLSIPGANATSDITTITAGNGLTIQPLVLTTVSGTGGALTLKGGNETGTTSTGGALTLDTGTGTSTNGTIQIGNTVAGNINIGTATGAKTITIGETGSTANTIAIGTGTGADTINIGTGATGADVIGIGSANSGALTITAGASSTWSTSGASSNLTIQAGSTTASTALTLKSANQSGASTNSGGVTINTGNAAGATSTAGNIVLDVGTSTTSNGSILIGTAARAQTITIGNSTGGTITIGASSGSDLALNDAQWSVTGAGVANFVTGTVIGSQTFTTNNIADSGALTIKSATTNALTLDSGTTGTINIGTGTSGKTINIATDNTTADTVVIGSALDTIRLAKFSTVNGVLYVDNANGNVSETAASTGVQCLQTSGVGTAPIWGACSGAAGAALHQITAATATNTIANANFAQTWNWGTLTTETGMTFGGGTAMTTGSIFALGGATYVHTAAETGSSHPITFTDASTNTTGNSITNGLNIAATVNTSGAGTKAINGIRLAAPSITGCATGACTLDGVQVNTITAGAASTITSNGLDVQATGIGAGTLNGINISSITAGAGTETAINAGNNWDTGISIGTGVTTAINISSGQIVASNTGIEFTESDTNPTCAAGNFNIYADLSENKVKKCQNGVVSDINAIPDMPTFVDTTANTVVDADTTNYWDGTAPNITPKSTASEILVMMSANITGTTATDTQISAQILRHTAAITCQTVGTAVGGRVGTFQGAALAGVMINKIFVDTPATTSNIQYALCSSIDSEGAAGSVARIDFTLFEMNATTGDLAEVYPTNDMTLKQGDVVSIDQELARGVKKSTGSYDRQVLGVVSTNPALVIGGKGDQGVNGVPLALSGRVPLKVDTKNGPIKKGDVLTSSSTPGVAMKATKAGPIIGIALGEYNSEGIGNIEAFVKTGYYTGSNLKDILTSTTIDPARLTQNTIGKTALQYFMQHQDQYTGAGALNVSEILTDRLTAGLEVITPKVITDVLSVNGITSSTGTDVALNLTGDGKFIIKDENGNNAVTFDNQGNTFFKGVIIADKIKANQIEGLEILTNKISNLSSQVAGITTASASLSTSEESPSTTLGTSKPTSEVLPVHSDRLNLPSLNVEGLATVSGQLTANSLRVKNNSIFAGIIEALESITTKSLIVTDFAHFLSDVIFKGEVNFEGRPTFNKDMAGFAIVKKDADSVDVTFEKEYIATPLVNISVTLDETVTEQDRARLNPQDLKAKEDARNALEQAVLGGDVRYIVMRRTTKGFTIKLGKPAPDDIKFSWSALAVKDAKTATSQAVINTAQPSSLPTPSPNPSISSGPGGPTSSPAPPKTISINQTPTGFLRVRDGSSTSANEIGQVSPGQTFTVLDSKDNWYKIDYSSGQSGWVRGDYVTVN